MTPGRRAHLYADVSAYNDVVIHERARPVDVRQLAESLHDLTREQVDWPAVHTEYLRLFDVYSHDADALAYREARKHRSAKAEAAERRKARRR